MAFHAHIGRIQDMVEKLANATKTGVSWKRLFNDLYKKRTVILHGHKIPIAIIDGAIAIPAIGTENEARAWHNSKDWGDVPVVTFHFFADYLKGKAEEVPVKLNIFLGTLYGRMTEEFGNRRVVFSPMNPFGVSAHSRSVGTAGSGVYATVSTEENSSLGKNAAVSGQECIGQARPIGL